MSGFIGPTVPSPFFVLGRNLFNPYIPSGTGVLEGVQLIATASNYEIIGGPLPNPPFSSVEVTTVGSNAYQIRFIELGQTFFLYLDAAGKVIGEPPIGVDIQYGIDGSVIARVLLNGDTYQIILNSREGGSTQVLSVNASRPNRLEIISGPL